jgi:hypothetical protein
MLFLLACSLESIPPPSEPPSEGPAPEAVELAEPERPELIEAVETDEELAIPVEDEPEPVLPGPFGELEPGTVTGIEPLVNELSGVQAGWRGRLTLDLVVAGVPCKAGEITASEDRFSCTLSLPATLGGFAMTRGSEPGFYSDGSVAHFNFGDLVPPAESRLIEGVPCLSRVLLHPSGSVKRCTLSRQQAFGGVAAARSSDVELREDGSLLSLVTYADLEIRGRTYEAGLITFTEDGAIETHTPGAFGD